MVVLNSLRLKISRLAELSMAVLNSLRLKTSRQEVLVSLSSLTVLTELVLHNLASGGRAVTPLLAWPALLTGLERAFTCRRLPSHQRQQKTRTAHSECTY